MMVPGNYYIGDLCYVLQKEWVELNEVTKFEDGEFELKDGRKFAIYSTPGDGQYRYSDGAELSVDSGTIGCILISDIDEKDTVALSELGTVVYFDAPFNVSCSRDFIFFGSTAVVLSEEEEEEEEDEEEGEQW